jgi:hypothetical protein
MRPDTLSESADQFHPVNGLNPVPLEKFRGDGQLFCAAEASKRAIFWGEHISTARVLHNPMKNLNAGLLARLG